jgi:hypothetical protein
MEYYPYLYKNTSNFANYVFNTRKSGNATSGLVSCDDIDVDMYKSLGFTISLDNLLTCDTSV